VNIFHVLPVEAALSVFKVTLLLKSNCGEGINEKRQTAINAES
jgi:hypothetical protein